MSPDDSLLLATTRVSTFNQSIGLTNASGFLFLRDERLFVVTSRHVVIDPASAHFPDRLEIEIHLDPVDLTKSIGLSILLYKDGKSVWKEAKDSGGDIDVAVLELDRSQFPANAAVAFFTPEHLIKPTDVVPIGQSLLVTGFPLGFHDALHHLPVVRLAAVASAFGIRFQGLGFFLTDARTHRGTSGASVVRHVSEPSAAMKALPWQLLGVHSSRMDIGDRDLVLDESLGLNCAWYADILMTLTA